MSLNIRVIAPDALIWSCVYQSLRLASEDKSWGCRRGVCLPSTMSRVYVSVLRVYPDHTTKSKMEVLSAVR